MSEPLYLDDARLGRMSPSAGRALAAFTRFAGEAGGSLYAERFFLDGFQALSAVSQADFPELAVWRGLSEFRDVTRRLADVPSSRPVLFANRSASLMRLAAETVCRRSRRILTVDLLWGPYRRTLDRTARRRGVPVTCLRLRRRLLTGKLSRAACVAELARCYTAESCDAFVAPSVDNLGVRLPVESFLSSLPANRRPAVTVIDAAQALGHLPPGEATPDADLILVGFHKWMGGYLPLSALLSRIEVERLAKATDPLLRLTTACCRPGLNESVNLTPLITARAAVEDCQWQSRSAFPTRRANAALVRAAARELGWRAPALASGLGSGVVVLQRPSDGNDFDSLRRRLGVAASVYPNGRVRLSMPIAPISGADLIRLRTLFGESSWRTPSAA